MCCVSYGLSFHIHCNRCPGFTTFEVLIDLSFQYHLDFTPQISFPTKHRSKLKNTTEKIYRMVSLVCAYCKRRKYTVPPHMYG